MATTIEAISGLFDDGGRAVLQEAELADWKQALGDVPADLLRKAVDSRDEAILALSKVRELRSQQGKLRQAIAFTRGLLAIQTAAKGEDHPDALAELGALGALADRVGRTDQAWELLDRAYRGLRSRGGGRDLRLAIVASNLGVHWVRRDDIDKAEGCLEQAYRIWKDVAPASIGVIAAQLGEIRLRKGAIDDALPLLQEAWSVTKAQLGPQHPRTLNRARVLLRVLKHLEHWTAAVEPAQTLFDAAQKAGNIPEEQAARFDLGVALHGAGRTEEGFRLVEESVRWARARADIDLDPRLPDRLTVWARLVIDRGRAREAEGILLEALEMEKRLHGDQSPEVGLRMASLGWHSRQLGRRQEGLGWLEAATSTLRVTRGDAHGQTRAVCEMLAEALLYDAAIAKDAGDRDLAMQLASRAEQISGQILGPAHRRTREAREFRV